MLNHHFPSFAAEAASHFFGRTQLRKSRTKFFSRVRHYCFNTGANWKTQRANRRRDDRTSHAERLEQLYPLTCAREKRRDHDRIWPMIKPTSIGDIAWPDHVRGAAELFRNIVARQHEPNR